MDFFLAFKATRPLSLRYTNGGYSKALTGRGFSLASTDRAIVLQIDMTHNLRKRDKSTTIAADAHRLTAHNYSKLTTLSIEQAAVLMSKLEHYRAKVGDLPELQLTLLLDQPRSYLATASERHDTLVISVTTYLGPPPPAGSDTQLDDA